MLLYLRVKKGPISARCLWGLGEGDSSLPAFDMVCFELGTFPFPLEINVSKVGELVA